MQLTQIIIDSGWAAPIVAIALAPVIAIGIIVDVISLIFCFFGGCPTTYEDPQWLEAGDVADFDLWVGTSTLEAGYIYERLTRLSQTVRGGGCGTGVSRSCARGARGVGGAWIRRGGA